MKTQLAATRPLPTPLGMMLAIASPDGLAALEFVKKDRLTDLERRLGDEPVRNTTPDPASVEIIDAASSWLDEYFAGRSFAKPRFPLDLVGTSFEREVWDKLLRIPAGAVRTYSSIATELSRPNGARAVGGAVGRNPLAIIVPCHRVVGASGSLTGYGGGLGNKRWLLEHEGIKTGSLFV